MTEERASKWLVQEREERGFPVPQMCGLEGIEEAVR